MSKHEGGLKAEQVRTMLHGIEGQMQAVTFALDELAMEEGDRKELDWAADALDDAATSLRKILRRHDALTA